MSVNVLQINILPFRMGKTTGTKPHLPRIKDFLIIHIQHNAGCLETNHLSRFCREMETKGSPISHQQHSSDVTSIIPEQNQFLEPICSVNFYVQLLLHEHYK